MPEKRHIPLQNKIKAEKTHIGTSFAIQRQEVPTLLQRTNQIGASL